MSSLVPPAYTTYPGSYNTVPLQTNIRPNNPITPNNEAYVPLQFDWSQLYAANNPNTVSLCYLANVGLAPNALDFIRCLVIDNSYCEWDIHIQFLDGFTLSIPAWEPLDVYPIITTQKAFYVWCESLSPINVIQGPPILGRHSTTNIFVCNANIPPTKAKVLNKEVFLFTGIVATGTTTFIVGSGGQFVNSAQAILKKIIVMNNSNFTASSIIGVTVAIDGSNFMSFIFTANSSSPSFNATPPLIIDNLNIRCAQIAMTVSTANVSVLDLPVTIVYVDHSGLSVLT